MRRLSELTSDKMSHLGTGEAYVWSSKASDDTFTRGAVKINCRPHTQHGGSTENSHRTSVILSYALARLKRPFSRELFQGLAAKVVAIHPEQDAVGFGVLDEPIGKCACREGLPPRPSPFG